MTLAPEIAGSPTSGAPMPPPTSPSAAPVDTIPLQSGPSITVSLTGGCEAPMDALRSADPDLALRCHPCDEAVVRLLIVRTRRNEQDLIVTPSICPGTLCLG